MTESRRPELYLSSHSLLWRIFYNTYRIAHGGFRTCLCLLDWHQVRLVSCTALLLSREPQSLPSCFCTVFSRFLSPCQYLLFLLRAQTDRATCFLFLKALNTRQPPLRPTPFLLPTLLRSHRLRRMWEEVSSCSLQFVLLVLSIPVHKTLVTLLLQTLRFLELRVEVHAELCSPFQSSIHLSQHRAYSVLE